MLKTDLPKHTAASFERIVTAIEDVQDYRFLLQLKDALYQLARYHHDPTAYVLDGERAYQSLAMLMMNAMYQLDLSLQRTPNNRDDNADERALRMYKTRKSLHNVLRRFPRMLPIQRGKSLERTVVHALTLVLHATEKQLEEVQGEPDPQAAWNIYVARKKQQL